MVQLLLQEGANPNQNLPGKSTNWAIFLSESSQAKGLMMERDPQGLLLILRLLLEHGADPNLLSPDRYNGRVNHSFQELLKSREVQDLIASVAGSRRKEKSVLKRFSNKTKALWYSTKK